MPEFAPETCHGPLLQQAARALAFDEARDFTSWRRQVDAKLRQLIGWMPPPVPLNVQRQPPVERETFTETRFVFTSEAHADVPAHLLVPRGRDAPLPVVICLQGHSTGMHISLGRAVHEGDEEEIAGDRDFAVQAVRRGYAALALEQRCFGQRTDQRPDHVREIRHPCHHATMVSLLLGRTMIGQRVWDVMRAIDALEQFEHVDTSRIACMGNSGGGTTTYFAACLDRRIGVAMPSCYVCTFADSIGVFDHCADNYIPGILQWFEMGDLAGLVAPRPLIIVAGRTDKGFPIDAVQKGFETIQRIYKAAGAPDRCRLVIGDDGHRFYADESWPVFDELSGW